MIWRRRIAARWEVPGGRRSGTYSPQVIDATYKSIAFTATTSPRHQTAFAGIPPYGTGNGVARLERNEDLAAAARVTGKFKN
jgi:hypothetical protein